MPEETSIKIADSMDTEAALNVTEATSEQSGEQTSDNRNECSNGVCAVVWKPHRNAA